LAARAGARVDEVLVMDASRQGRHTNAYVAGVGPTRVVVLYDTLLQSHPPDEVVSILAHELGHWRRDHVLKGTLLAGAGAFLGCFVLAALLRRMAGRPSWNLSCPSDPAGLPAIAFLAWLAAWAAVPVESALTRRFEREADADALALTADPQAFIASEKRLVRDNLLDVAPPPAWVWMFATHPTPVERIEAAERWAVTRGP
ncbi:MAG: M48 family metalloprotease, partial [Planctomycetota bacterium]